MSPENAAGIPAPERTVVGLCHDMNDQLAAVSAYVYLLERRGKLGDMGGALQAHLDRLASCGRCLGNIPPYWSPSRSAPWPEPRPS